MDTETLTFLTSLIGTLVNTDKTDYDMLGKEFRVSGLLTEVKGQFCKILVSVGPFRKLTGYWVHFSLIYTVVDIT